MSWFERIASVFVALNFMVPINGNKTVTDPLASVVPITIAIPPLTFTVAPVTGLPVWPSVTVRTAGVLGNDTVPGPVSFKKELALKASNANRISSFCLTSCWQPPTGVNSKLRSIPQNWVAVWVSPPMEVMKKSSNSVENVLQRFPKKD